MLTFYLCLLNTELTGTDSQPWTQWFHTAQNRDVPAKAVQAVHLKCPSSYQGMKVGGVLSPLLEVFKYHSVDKIVSYNIPV